MSTIVIDGYVIDPAEPSIDFANVPNFDPARLDAVFEPRSRNLLYRNPAYLSDRFEWIGKKLVLKPNRPIAYLGESTLVFTYAPALAGGDSI